MRHPIEDITETFGKQTEQFHSFVLSWIEKLKRRGSGTVLPAPAFAADGDAATTRFVQGGNGTWTLTTFAEMSNDALGADVADGQIRVYAAPTVEGLDAATPLTSGVTVKKKKSAVKTVIEVTPPGNRPSQFFKVKFGE